MRAPINNHKHNTWLYRVFTETGFLVEVERVTEVSQFQMLPVRDALERARAVCKEEIPEIGDHIDSFFDRWATNIGESPAKLRMELRHRVETSVDVY